MRSKTNLVKAILGLCSALVPSAAQAASDAYADYCKSLVIRPIALLYQGEEGVSPADQKPSINKGTVIRRVTQYRVVKTSGLTGFCAQYDTCYRATATVNGRQVEAQRLLNCTIDHSSGEEMGDEVIYGLALDPRKNSARVMQIDQAFRRLLSLDVESTRLARALVDAPRSRCGRIARLALAGNKRILAALRKAELPPFGMTAEKAAEQIADGSFNTDYRDCI